MPSSGDDRSNVPTPLEEGGTIEDASATEIDASQAIEPSEAEAQIASADSGAGTCAPVFQRTGEGHVPGEGETPKAGLLLCEEQSNQTFLVDELPQRCERVGEDWTTWDAGRPVECAPGVEHCGSELCDPVSGNCLALSQCVEDSDCPAAQACLCSSFPGRQVNRCVPAECRSGAECGAFACAVSDDICQQPEYIACHTKDDECQLNGDCGDHSRRCAFDPEARYWRCMDRAICD